MQFYVLCFLLFVATVSTKKLPSYLELCPKSVREAGPCIMKNVKILQPKMEKGIPELLIPALNPLELSKANLDTPGIKAVFNNALLYHLHVFDLKHVKFNLDTLDIEIEISFPKIDANSDYTLNGKILILELNSKGKALGNFTNLSADVKGKLAYVQKNGKKHLKVDNTDIIITIGKTWMNFENLFKDKQLSDNANKVINENSEEVMKDFIPVVNKIIQGIVIGITNRILDKFSFDELFP